MSTATVNERRELRALPTDPPCPRCGRRYARKYLKAHAQKATLLCDPDRVIGGCGHEWQA